LLAVFINEKSFIASYFYFILELIQEFKDLAIIDGYATKSQIQGSKSKMVTSTNMKSQPTKFFNTISSKSKSSEPTSK
jgi:hypothetical protein